MTRVSGDGIRHEESTVRLLLFVICAHVFHFFKLQVTVKIPQAPAFRQRGPAQARSLIDARKSKDFRGRGSR